jgi:hypothetical protein
VVVSNGVEGGDARDAPFIQKGRIRSMHCKGQIISKLEFV